MVEFFAIFIAVLACDFAVTKYVKPYLRTPPDHSVFVKSRLEKLEMESFAGKKV